MSYRRNWIQYHHNADTNGCTFPFPSFHSGAKTSLCSVALYEFMLRFAFPLCSHLPHPSPTTPISSAVSIIDLKDVSLGSIWSLRSHLQEASRLGTDNYPETLGTIVVVNSPAFFPTVWGWVKVGGPSLYCSPYSVLLNCFWIIAF